MNTDEGFHVTSSLTKSFNPEIEQSVNAGTQITFRFYLSLKKLRWYWDNEIIAEEEYQHTVTYDTLRKIYTVIIYKGPKQEQISERTTSDPIEMRKWMNSFSGDLSLNQNDFVVEKQYYLSLRAKLETGKMPQPLSMMLFFISNDFDTKTSRQWLPVKTTK